MRKILVSLALALAVVLAPPARAQAPGPEIGAVIGDQIAAFQSGDIARAWSHASPSIQRMFGSPERFGRMVREGYPMVWRPARWEFRELTETAGGLIQTVLFQDAAGRLFLADYEMQLVDGVWRINGVYLRPAPGVGI